MQSIYNAIGAFVGWYWGIPILIILIGGGIALTAIIGGVQFSRLGFIFKHTLGTIFNKEEQARKKAARHHAVRGHDCRPRRNSRHRQHCRRGRGHCGRRSRRAVLDVGLRLFGHGNQVL